MDRRRESLVSTVGLQLELDPRFRSPHLVRICLFPSPTKFEHDLMRTYDIFVGIMCVAFQTIWVEQR
jgi:hypothetical protein